jgi:perosamine synthetase
MDKKYIPVNEPLLDGNEKKYLIQCIETGWISSEGPYIKEFENKFAMLVDRKHAIAVTNGTAAIDVAIEAIDISSGDEVIMPAFTIISCILQIIRKGAKPVLIDSDPITWNMDVNQIEQKITSRTKAIMIVHIYGLPVNIDPVLDIAKRYKLKIIEDSAQMHGQYYKNMPCGSFGDISTFSFYPNKLITTGEGGMIVTNDDKLAEICRSLRNLCFDPKNRFVHERLGWNLRMTNLQAAIGMAQFERLSEFIKNKRHIGSIYTKKLSSIKALQLPKEKMSYADNIYWVYGVVIKNEVNIDAKDAISQLESYGIGARPFFCPMNMQPILKTMGMFNGEVYPEAERLYKKGFYIPSGIALTNDQIERVVIAMKKVFG